MAENVWNVRAYFDYDLEASNEEEAMDRLAQCIYSDLEEGANIKEISEVVAKKVSDKEWKS